MTQENTSPETQDETNAAAETVPPQAQEEALAAAQAEVASLKDQLLRQIAETENVRRRLEREKQDAGAYAVTSFARDILAVADNLRRALDAVPEAARADPAVANVITGIEMTEREVFNVFNKYGIAPIEALGQKLDPNKHQAMLEIPTNEVEPGTVVQVLQSGFLIKDRLLRPALVAVAKPLDGAPGSTVDTNA